jgi:hypothetical protein
MDPITLVTVALASMATKASQKVHKRMAQSGADRGAKRLDVWRRQLPGGRLPDVALPQDAAPVADPSPAAPDLREAALALPGAAQRQTRLANPIGIPMPPMPA